MKKILVCILVSFVFFAGCGNNDKLFEWAKNLAVQDVTVIEAVSMPSDENHRYKNYDASEFSRIVDIVNSVEGKKAVVPQEIVGGVITFYITTSDGERHTFANNGNTYLVIDGVSYRASYDWLSGWGEESLDSKMPDDFFR
jgi:hypothetical protein